MDRSSAWRKANPEKAREIDRTYRAKRRTRGLQDCKTLNRVALRKRDPSLALLQGAKATAKRKGLPFDLTVDDLIIPGQCPVLGVDIVLEPFRHDHGPSVDRLIPSKGYVRGNVVVMSMKANRMKSNATVDEVDLLLRFMRAANL